MAGKLDWLAHNLPTEGEHADAATVGAVARDDVVTCGLNDRVGRVRPQIEATAYPFALVTAPAGVLLGRLRGRSLDCDPNLRAEEVMEPGPSTVRADTPACAAMRGAVGRRSPSSISAMTASTTA